MSGIKHILVIRLSAMGDVAMTVPMLKAFRIQYPEVKITVLSRPFFQPLFEDIPNVTFFAIDVKEKHKGFSGLIRLFRELKLHNIHAVADLHNVLRTKVITKLFALSGKKTAVVDKGRAEKKALTRIHNKIFRQLTPMVERHANVFKQLGFPIDFKISDSPQKKELSKEIIAITGIKNQNWVGIAPFAQHLPKVYPQDLMQQVIDSLAKDINNKILLFGGGANEIAVLNQFSDNYKNVIVVAGKITFKQELELISNLDCMLSMDSGNAHIASLFGVKVITLWGATHPYAGFYPFNQPLENAICADREKYPLLPTSIYGNKMIEGYKDAMRTIEPDTVVQKIIQVIKKG